MLPRKTGIRNITLACVLSVVCSGQTPEQLSKAAAAALERRQYSEAERIYQELAVLLPDVPEIESNLGLARYFQHNFSSAETAFRSALTRNPKLFVPNFFLGRIYFMASRHAQALPLLQRALEARQNEHLVRQMLAAVYVGLGRISDARAQYVSLLKENASDIDALYGLGRTYLHLGRQAFEKLSKHKQSAFYVLAKAEFEASRPRRFHELAEKYYRQSIEISPDTPGLRVRLGSFLLNSGNTKEARTTLEDELKLDRYSYESRFLLSFARLLEGETDAALQEINEAVRIRPEFFDPLPTPPVERKHSPPAGALSRQEQPRMMRERRCY